MGFVRRSTTVATPPLVPEIRLHLATEVTPLWQATEVTLERTALPPPFWAFAWAGGQAAARYLLDHPGLLRGRRVLDVGAGSGLVAIAAALAGAAQTVAADIDPIAATAQRLNAALNDVALTPLTQDPIGTDAPLADVIVAADVCYEAPLANRLWPWLRALAGAGRLVIIADPGRKYLMTDSLVPLATYTVPTPLDLEDRDRRETTVWLVSPSRRTGD